MRHVDAEVDCAKWTVPDEFEWIVDRGNVQADEMLRVFNCGIGFVVIVAKRHESRVLEQLRCHDRAFEKTHFKNYIF